MYFVCSDLHIHTHTHREREGEKTLFDDNCVSVISEAIARLAAHASVFTLEGERGTEKINREMKKKRRKSPQP